MMDDLVAFLRARYDGEEGIAREATPGPWQNAPTARHHPTASGRTEEAVFASPRDTGAVVVAATGETGERRNVINAEHIARFADPARVLAEVDAKRRIIDEYERMASATYTGAETASADIIEPFIRILAQVYADHPDYQQEWRP